MNVKSRIFNSVVAEKGFINMSCFSDNFSSGGARLKISHSAKFQLNFGARIKVISFFCDSLY